MPAATDLNVDFLANMAVQLPLLVLFIWYNDRMTRRFDQIQKDRDAQFLASIEKVTNHVSDAVKAIEAHDSHVERRIQELRTDATRPYRRKGDDVGE